MNAENSAAAAFRRLGCADFKAIFNLSPNSYAVLAPDLSVVAVNEAYLRITGKSRSSLLGIPLLDAFPGEPGDLHCGQLQASLEQVLDKGKPHSLALVTYPVPATEEAGEEHYWSATHVPIADESGAVSLVLQHIVDVTHSQERKKSGESEELPSAAMLTAMQIEEGIFRRVQLVQEANRTLDAERRRLRRLFEQAPGFVCILRGPEHVFELSNEAYRHLVGRDPLGYTIREALPELAGQRFFDLLDEVYASGETFVGRAERVVLQQQSEEAAREAYVDFVYQPIIEADGSVSGIFVQGHDVSESHRLEEQLRYQASHDALTGLVNRQEFEDRLAQLINHVQQTRSQSSMLYLDLDQFKVVNDTCSHEAGDELLQYVSDLLSQAVDDGMTLGRLGGDEFGILLPGCSVEVAEQVAEELRELIAEAEFCWGQRRFGLSISVGVVSFDGSGFTLKEVLSTADSACFLAKEKGRNRVHVHHPADAELAARLREMDWVGRLRDALQENRLLLFGQRIRALGPKGHEMDRMEVLARVRDVDDSIIEPMAFIPAAERYNLMPMVDRYVVRATLEHIAGELTQGRACVPHAINISGTTLSDDSFVPFVRAQIAEYGVPAYLICFEITETAAVTNLTETARMIHQLRVLGFRFALDDFGSGMSSFGYLKSLPVDYLKIDGSFVKDIADDPVDCAMVEAIIRVAHVMGIKTIAEYAESEAIIERLTAIGADFAQGHAVHRPEPLASA